MMIQPLVAAALLLAQAPPAAPNCVTREEAGNLAVAILPHVVDGLAEQCRPHLQPDAFLVSRGEALSERLHRDAVPRREAALRTMGTISGERMPPGVRPDTAMELVAQMLTGGMLGSANADSCVDIDTLVAALEPLPTDNIARLAGAVLSLARVGEGDSDGDSDGDGEESGRQGPPICRP